MVTTNIDDTKSKVDFFIPNFDFFFVSLENEKILMYESFETKSR